MKNFLFSLVVALGLLGLWLNHNPHSDSSQGPIDIEVRIINQTPEEYFGIRDPRLDKFPEWKKKHRYTNIFVSSTEGLVRYKKYLEEHKDDAVHIASLDMDIEQTVIFSDGKPDPKYLRDRS